MKNLLNHLEEIYKQIPPLPYCKQCGECCISVNMTLLELIYMFQYLLKTYSKRKITEILTQPITISKNYKGNFLLCRMQDHHSLCLAYEGRAFSCRAGGHPALDSLYKKNCFKLSTDDYKQKDDFSLEQYWKWFLKLERMDSMFGTFSEPLEIARLTFEAWLSIYFEENPIDELKKIQVVLHENIDLNFLKNKYKDFFHFNETTKVVLEAKILLEKKDFISALDKFLTLIEENISGYYLEESIYYAGYCIEILGKKENAIEMYNMISPLHPYHKKAEERLKVLSEEEQEFTSLKIAN